MEKIKDFWNNKTEQEKRKIIVYSVAGLLSFLLIIAVVLLNGGNNEQTVSEISNPDAKEAQKYNSRTEANQLGRKDSSSMNSSLDNLFGSSEPEPVDDFYYDNSGGAYQEPTYQEPSYSIQRQPSSNRSSGGSGYNSHNTYGDYSMWQGSEPKNNSIGYTEIQSYPDKKQPNANRTEINNPEPVSAYEEPFSNYPSEKKLSDGTQIRAKLISQGYVNSGRSLSFVLLEPSVINGVQTAKGQVVTGVASENNGRLNVNFSTIKVKNKIVPAQIQLYGSDGVLGLPISGGENTGSNMNNVGGRARDVASSQVNRIPVVGGIIGSAIGAGSRTADNRIKLSSNIECIIVVY